MCIVCIELTYAFSEYDILTKYILTIIVYSANMKH